MESSSAGMSAARDYFIAQRLPSDRGLISFKPQLRMLEVEVNNKLFEECGNIGV
jgi:hypothetical protein